MIKTIVLCFYPVEVTKRKHHLLSDSISGVSALIISVDVGIQKQKWDLLMLFIKFLCFPLCTNNYFYYGLVSFLHVYTSGATT